MAGPRRYKCSIFVRVSKRARDELDRRAGLVGKNAGDLVDEGINAFLDRYGNGLISIPLYPVRDELFRANFNVERETCIRIKAAYKASRFLRQDIVRGAVVELLSSGDDWFF